MKKICMALFSLFLALSSVTPVYAAGDKVEATEEALKKPVFETEAAGTEMPAEEEAGGGSPTKVILIFGGLCVLIVAGICLAVLMRKDKLEEGQGEHEKSGIPMRLLVYAGTCASDGKTLYLGDGLTIGSSPDCDLVFEDPEVAPRNTRIFMKNDMVYIEDLNSRAGTALGGMRIQGQNRLRSGDVISIGSVEFSLKF